MTYQKKVRQMYFSPRGLRSIRQRRQGRPPGGKIAKRIRVGDVTFAFREHPEGGENFYIVRNKEGKWFTIPYDYDNLGISNEELEKIAKNFDKEWEARVGQYLDE